MHGSEIPYGLQVLSTNHKTNQVGHNNFTLPLEPVSQWTVWSQCTEKGTISQGNMSPPRTEQQTGLPTKDGLVEVLKSRCIKPLHEDVPMWVGGGDVLALEHGGNQGATPIATERKVFGVHHCMWNFHGGKLQHRFIVLSNGGVDGLLSLGDAQGDCDFLQQILKGKKLTA
eukprot:15325561-Ditylum_brightwellii.AAC.1